MTTKEIAEITGLSRDTILNKIKEKFPLKIQNGKTTRLNQEESILIVNELKVDVSRNIRPSNFSEVPSNFSEVIELFKTSIINQNKIIDLFDKRLSMIESSQPKQIESNKQKISVRDYINKNKITSFNINGFVIQVGKQLTRLSKELHRDIGFKRDGDYDVGLYDEDLFETAIIIARKMIEKDNVLFKD
jgi:hypothetical protein